MADAWLPGAERLRSGTDAGPMRGGAPRVVWSTVEIDPAVVSARSAAQRLDHLGRPVHLVWNPLCGQATQLLPVTLAACGLRDSEGTTAAANHEGRVCVQISVVGFAGRPFTDGPMSGLERIMSWLDDWGVPRRWPVGPPGRCPRHGNAAGTRRQWSLGGHFGACQVPGCLAAGPGTLDVARITGCATPPSPPVVPLPRNETGVSIPTNGRLPALRDAPLLS